MKEIKESKTLDLLQTIMEFELAGVLRYAHYSLVVNDATDRDSIVDFLKDQADESLEHAIRVGEMLKAVNGYPKFGICGVEELSDYSSKSILIASLAHEKKALEMYRLLLETAEGVVPSVATFAHNMITEEGGHFHELQELVNNYP
jgi:bacterioferritin